MSSAAESRVRIAFLGGSHSHAFAKAKVAQQSPDYELVGVWEEDPKVMAEYTAIGIKAVKPDEVLKDTSIQAIAVESAVKDHAKHALMALEAGKHVHVEKPPADTMAAFHKLVAAAEKKKLLLQTGYMWRYNPAVNKGLEAARNGWLGDVYMVRAQMNTLIAPERRPEWGMFRGGQMFELGSHLIDVVVRLLGRPDKVTPFLKHHGKFDDLLKDNTVAVFEYPKALAIIQTATLQPGSGAHRGIEILGTNGTAVVRPVEPAVIHIDLAKAAGPYKEKSQNVPVPRLYPLHRRSGGVRRCHSRSEIAYGRSEAGDADSGDSPSRLRSLVAPEYRSSVCA